MHSAVQLKYLLTLFTLRFLGTLKIYWNSFESCLENL